MQGKIKDIAEQYLKLCGELSNKKAEGIAHLQLGKICITEKNYAKGNQNFAKALKLSREAKDVPNYTEAKCNYAFTNAHLKLQDHFNTILKTIDKPEGK